MSRLLAVLLVAACAVEPAEPEGSGDAPALPPGDSAVTIQSSPSGAEVRMGPRRLGATPLVLSFPRHARYRVELRFPGHRPRLLTIETQDLAEQVLDVELQPEVDRQTPSGQ